MHHIPSDVAFWAMLILGQIHLLKNGLLHQRIDAICAVSYTGLAALICIARMAAMFIT
jgi:hypothetical protein|nr:MAG TPA: hypothetical protein [Caudoviricetes sp.]